MKIHTWQSFNEEKDFTSWLKNPSQEGYYTFSITSRVKEIINTEQDWLKIFNVLSEEGYYNFDNTDILESFISDLINHNKYEDIFRYYHDLAQGEDLYNYLKKSDISFENILIILDKAFDTHITEEVEFVECLKQHFILQDIDINSYQKQFKETEHNFINKSFKYILKHDDELFSEAVYQYFQRNYRCSVDSYFQTHPMYIDLVESDEFYSIRKIFNAKALEYIKDFKADFKILDFKMSEKIHQGRAVILDIKTDRILSAEEEKTLGQHVEKYMHIFSRDLEQDEERDMKGLNSESIKVFATVEFTHWSNNDMSGIYEFKQILK